MVGRLHYYLEPQGAAEKLDVLVQRALPVFQAARDDLALYIAYSALGAVASMRAHMDAWRDADEQAFIHAQRAGLIHHRELGRVSARFFGTTPVTELLAWLDEQEAGGIPARYLRSYRALALAMLGSFDEARALLADIRADLADRGGGLVLGTAMGQDQVLVELLAGDFATAAEVGQEACKLLDELGEKSILSTAAGRLAQALYALDRLGEADAWADRASELGATDDAMTQMLWRQVRAKVLAKRGATVLSHSPARRWPSARGPTCSTTRVTRSRTSARCCGSPASRTRRSLRWRRPWSATSAKETRLRAACADATGRDPPRGAGTTNVAGMQFDTKMQNRTQPCRIFEQTSKDRFHYSSTDTYLTSSAAGLRAGHIRSFTRLAQASLYSV